MKVLACAAAAMAAFLSCAPARAELNSCTEITALPFTISTQGVYCLKQNLNVNLSAEGSAAITINAGNVTIDFNGFRVNNQAPLASNFANGVYAQDRNNITLKNGFMRGFYIGVYLNESTTDASSSHLVESMKIADSGSVGIVVNGDKSVIRDNRVLATGGGTFSSGYGIFLVNADDGLVSGNIVAGVTETSGNYGVNVSVSIRVNVTGNTISGVNGGTNDRAITLISADHAIIAQNRLLNDPATGTGGIVDIGGSDNVACLDNEIGGFGTNPTADCDFSDGNRKLFD